MSTNQTQPQQQHQQQPNVQTPLLTYASPPPTTQVVEKHYFHGSTPQQEPQPQLPPIFAERGRSTSRGGAPQEQPNHRRSRSRSLAFPADQALDWGSIDSGFQNNPPRGRAFNRTRSPSVSRPSPRAPSRTRLFTSNPAVQQAIKEEVQRQVQELCPEADAGKPVSKAKPRKKNDAKQSGNTSTNRSERSNSSKRSQQVELFVELPTGPSMQTKASGLRHIGPESNAGQMLSKHIVKFSSAAGKVFANRSAVIMHPAPPFVNIVGTMQSGSAKEEHRAVATVLFQSSKLKNQFLQGVINDPTKPRAVTEGEKKQAKFLRDLLADCLEKFDKSLAALTVQSPPDDSGLQMPADK